MGSKRNNGNYACILVPSLAANDFAISESGAGYGVTEMKTALLAMDDALMFDTTDTNLDYITHSVTIEHEDGVEYNNRHVEALNNITIVCESDPTVGETGETARTSLDDLHGSVVDAYAWDPNQRTTTDVIKMVGVVLSRQKTWTPGSKPTVTLVGKVTSESDITDNRLNQDDPAT